MKKVILFLATLVQLLAGGVCAFAETAPDVSAATTEAVNNGGNPVNFNWPVLIGVSVVISLIIAVVLAFRKADKIYGKGFDD